MIKKIINKIKFILWIKKNKKLLKKGIFYTNDAFRL